MSNEDAFLGVGWSFPPSFDKKARAVRMVSEDDDIKQSLRIILTTAYGERVMRPEFGSNISEINFTALTSNVLNDLRSYIEQAVLEFEPRVTLNKIELDQSEIYEGILRIKLDYIIRKINVRTNIVFPFYFKEGTNITAQ
jgi:uncharacterized protein